MTRSGSLVKSSQVNFNRYVAVTKFLTVLRLSKSSFGGKIGSHVTKKSKLINLLFFDQQAKGSIQKHNHLN